MKSVPLTEMDAGYVPSASCLFGSCGTVTAEDRYQSAAAAMAARAEITLQPTFRYCVILVIFPRLTECLGIVSDLFAFRNKVHDMTLVICSARRGVIQRLQLVLCTLEVRQ